MKTKIIFGPSGLGPSEQAIKNLEHFSALGLRACEVAFTYGVYLKKEESIKIGQISKKLGIKLSIHAPYWINLNSKENAKIYASKLRILKSCEIAHYLHAENVVFHAGFYKGIGKTEQEKKEIKEKTFQNIRLAIIDLQEQIKKNKWNVKLCPETMGKKNVFGSVQEIARLVNETGCSFCIDFAHILARYGKYDFALVEKNFPQKKWHVHFSGIEYGEKGEKHHKLTEKKSWQALFKGIPSNKEIVIINESPNPVNDSIEGLQIFGGMR